MGIPGGYGTGWVQGRGNTGVQHTARGEVNPSEAGPVRLLQGAWSGWGLSSGAPSPGTTTPCGRARFAVPGLPHGQNPASWPITARIDLFLWKVSQNAGVSPKYVNKACLSPYFQNGLRKSALEFLGFPFSVAFSHKELMVPFMART